MNLNQFFQLAGIPILGFVVCVYYGIRLVIMQDVNAVRGKFKEPVKDEKGYSKEGGRLIIGLGAAFLLMGMLLFVNVTAAVIQIAVCTVIFGVLWKKMNDKYGA
ncbi:MAG: hypothetical protein PHP50_12905 [Lachnospiraceae bacterium]|nr:hypothetical protein [Lachnospiraceae bacterium]